MFPPELIEHRADTGEPHEVDSIQPLVSVRTHNQETGVPQDPEVLACGRLPDACPSGQFACATLRLDAQLDDDPPNGMREGAELVVHAGHTSRCHR